MTCYLTDKTTPEDIHAAKEAGVLAFKLYPAGATTNSDSGVTRQVAMNPCVILLCTASFLGRNAYGHLIRYGWRVISNSKVVSCSICPW